MKHGKRLRGRSSVTYLLGLDVGTTGVKTLLVKDSGDVVASATSEYPMQTPKPLWAEQAPEDWWSATKLSIRGVLSQAAVKPEDVKGIGLTGQMHGLVMVDKNREVLRPCIMWNDQRTGAECEAITKKVGLRRLMELTGNPVFPGFTAPKILWVRENEPQVFRRASHVLLPKDYIRLRLTGEFATDVSDASGTSLLNVRERRWCEEILTALDIPIEWMPGLHESTEITGQVARKVTEETGLRPGTPVVAGGGDQAAGAVGNGIVSLGVVSVTLGTSGVVFAHTDQVAVEKEGRLHAFCHAVPNAWHVMGVTLAAGGSFRWFRDTLGDSERGRALQSGVDPYEILTEEAERAPAGSEGLIFLPYLTGERTPYADPSAKGAFVGLTVRHSRAHVIRSVLEGVAFSLRDCLELIQALGLRIDEIRISGGGARSLLWRQILADVFGNELTVLSSTEGAPFGAALLAGVGTGVYQTVAEACKDTVKVAARIEPDASRARTYESLYDIYRGMYRTLKPSFDSLSKVAEQSSN